MKQFRRCTRICILSSLCLSLLVPIILLSSSKEFIEDLSILKLRPDSRKLNLVKQDESEGVKEPVLEVYKDLSFHPPVGFGSSDVDIKFARGDEKSAFYHEGNETTPDAKGTNGQSQPEKMLPTSGSKEEVFRPPIPRDNSLQPPEHRVMDQKIKEAKDQLIRAKAYLSFAIQDNNNHLIKELRLRIKELERAMGETTEESTLPKRVLQRMKAMEGSLLKAHRMYPSCSNMVKKLRAMTNNAEEQVRVQKEEEVFLVQLAGRTTPKGLHCLSMKLTAEYFDLPPQERELPSSQDVHHSDLYHFAVLSDNILACAVVVDSTISTAKEPEKIAFHVVTDSLNFAAISMWFILHPPGKARVKIHSMENFRWFATKYEPVNIEGHNSQDPRYTSALNHLRFYLPDIFPTLNKILLLDHDVVVQRDLTDLWRIDMLGKVNGAVETCPGNDPAFRRMDLLINFSDPMVARRFRIKPCSWAFGMNVFDLREWRRRGLTAAYRKYLQLGKRRPLWKAGSLALGWITFYNETTALDQRWHVHGLGSHPGIRQKDIEEAAVIHYDGVNKPWLDIGIENYRDYWRKHVKYDDPYLQQCNIT